MVLHLGQQIRYVKREEEEEEEKKRRTHNDTKLKLLRPKIKRKRH